MPTGAGFGGYGFMHEFPVADEPGRKRLSVPAAFSQVHEPGSVFTPRTQSVSLDCSSAAVDGRAGDPGGNCWLARRIVPPLVWISTSS